MVRKIHSVDTGATGNNRKDCAVRALANAADIPYQEALECLNKHGRKDDKGTMPWTMIDAYKEYGFECKMVFGKTRNANYLGFTHPEFPRNTNNMTLGNLMQRLHKHKEYIVCISGHALAVVGGNIVDTFDNRAQKQVWCVFSR